MAMNETLATVAAQIDTGTGPRNFPRSGCVQSDGSAVSGVAVYDAAMSWPAGNTLAACRVMEMDGTPLRRP